MNVEGRIGYARRAELYLELIEQDIEGWREVGAFPGLGPPDPFDVLAILVSPRLEGILREAERSTGEPFLDRLKNLDVPVPILIVRTLEDDLWAGLERDDFEAVFTALGENAWTPTMWGEASLN